MTRSTLITALIGLCLAALSAFWLARNLSWETIQRDIGFKHEARRNDFYAAERLLDSLGEKAVSVREFVEWPALETADTLIMTTPGYALDHNRSRRLLDWVAHGGHLITTVYQATPARAGNHLLERLGIESHYNEGDKDNVLDVPLRSGSAPLKVDLRGDYFFVDTGAAALWSVGDEQGDYLLQTSWGEGLVTLISDLSVFSNARLGDHDHADFFWDLLHLDERFGKIWLQYTPRVATLGELLLRHAWMPLLGLTLTLLFAIRAAGARLGPVLALRPAAQRSLAEHLQASGRFLWRQGEGQTLLDAAQQRVFARLGRHLPRWRALSRERQVKYLAALTGLAHGPIERALSLPRELPERDFVTIIKILKSIEKKL